MSHIYLGYQLMESL
ncbi:hypothetical protein Ahy_B10g101797 isoform C [Arachis hypogaea]|uniref:Uncharacterized protein n=1 Tax=Arachis hypogaea TaxID=3818 RepID=A0A444X0P5_ARAHY|nr:hypothetical protein Ahy_B10g101797 isoform C [Arachis hypogaea]